MRILRDHHTYTFQPSVFDTVLAQRNSHQGQRLRSISEASRRESYTSLSICFRFIKRSSHDSRSSTFLTPND